MGLYNYYDINIEILQEHFDIIGLFWHYNVIILENWNLKIGRKNISENAKITISCTISYETCTICNYKKIIFGIIFIDLREFWKF